MLLAIIFAGVEDHPFGWTPGNDPIVTLWPVKGTTFVAGMSAFMNITYTFVGQITLPSVRLPPLPIHVALAFLALADHAHAAADSSSRR